MGEGNEPKPLRKARKALQNRREAMHAFRATPAEAEIISQAMELLTQSCLDHKVEPYLKADMMRGAVVAFCRDIVENGPVGRHFRPIEDVL